MMPTKVMDALAALLARDLPDGAGVHRHPLRPLERDQLPAIIPYFSALKPSVPQDVGNEMREYEASIRIECRAVFDPPGGNPMEDALWPLVLHVQRVMLGPPPPLDGWALGVTEESIQFDAFERSKTFCAAAMDYRLRIAYRIPPESSMDGGMLRDVEPCQHLS